MASIYQRINKDGSKVWRAVIRIKNHPTVSDHFPRKKEAEDWAKETEIKIKNGKYDFAKNKEKTLSELIDLYIQEAVVEHHKAADNTIFQLNYFKEEIGKLALTYITPELLIAKRKKLLSETNKRGKTLNPATVNRYFSTLSGAFRYACKNMRWIDENPCLNLLKLKTNPKI
ncbi:MAG: phage integrase SAM-like domain-containing protein [Proteobacteria bacterium]|nr:phage integrase SAM-like domain-containing protein [Pseudomonadota bacterium]